MASRTTAARGRAPSRTRPSPRKSAGSRDAWITDPNALLAALESAERMARDALVVHEPQAEEPRPARKPLALVAPEPEPEAPVALPALREDERVAHASKAGVVVIIRRRRAVAA